MTFRIYDKLCEDAKKLRTEVFVAEQGFETEFDDTDSKARHIVGYDGEKLMLKKICTPEFNDLLNEAM